MVNSRLEKYAIYSDGFRGLPDGWHNIRACNFLVGENSAGKSSFLQLIQLIDAREHRTFLEICGVIDGIDTAFDVCSRISGSNRTTVGFLIQGKEEVENKRFKGNFGRLASYKRKDDQMILEKVSIFSRDKIIRLKRVKKGIAYRVEPFAYIPQASHVDNGKRFQDIHFRTRNRFNKLKEFDWDKISETIAWINTIHRIEIDSQQEIGSYFMNIDAPLRCLHHGPIRSKPKRLHHGDRSTFSSTGEHTPYLLRDALKNNNALAETIEAFGKDSGLFETISIIQMKTSINDRPFAIQINKSGSPFYVDELGFGVSQILPIITDIAFTGDVHAFLIQQPELHLHPKAQAALGDVFMQSTISGKTFVIETHSDFIIDRFRILRARANCDTRAQIVYFEQTDKGKNLSHEIEIHSDGTLGSLPDGYRNFFVNESIAKLESL